MEQKLKDAAQVGDINTLYALIRENADLLDNIDKRPFVDTPLHIATSAGQTHFAIEVMSLKPSFGRKLNQDGFSPIHLALQKYYEPNLEASLIDKLAETVKRLIKIDSELIRVQGKERITPLHYVAERGDDDLLAEFLWACPASIEDLTIRCETAAHIAVKMNKFETFKVILGLLSRTMKQDVLNWKDEDGNTVLHIAASTNQEQVVRLLVNKIGVRRNAKNSKGLTARDIAFQQHETEDILGRACVVSSSSLPNVASRADFLRSREGPVERVLRLILMGRRELSIERRNLVLVVAVLVATAAYQASISPPRGVLPEPAGDSNTTYNITFVDTGTKDDDKNHVIELKASDFAATNTIAFTFGIGVILLVLQVRPYSVMLHISLVSLIVSFFSSTYFISESVLTRAVSYSAGFIFFLIYSVRICSHMEKIVPDWKLLALFHPDHLLPLLHFPCIINCINRYWMLDELIRSLDYSMSLKSLKMSQ